MSYRRVASTGMLGRSSQSWNHIDIAGENERRNRRVPREAIRLDPESFVSHLNLSGWLGNQKNYDEAEVLLRKAMRLGPKSVLFSHSNLGSVLAEQGKLAEAEAILRQGLRLKSAEYDTLHNLPSAEHATSRNLSSVLGRLGRFPEIETILREVIRAQPDSAGAYYLLSLYYYEQGQFFDCLAAARRSDELGRTTPGWEHPSAQQVLAAEQLVKMENRLPGLLKGDTKVSTPNEAIAFAEFCLTLKKYPAAALRFYAEAFRRRPEACRCAARWPPLQCRMRRF